MLVFQDPPSYNKALLGQICVFTLKLIYNVKEEAIVWAKGAFEKISIFPYLCSIAIITSFFKKFCKFLVNEIKVQYTLNKEITNDLFCKIFHFLIFANYKS